MDDKIFSIVIPAYNEEDAISSTLDRVLTARARIIEKTDISEVEIIVVNDGSRDRTADIVKGYTDRGIRLIGFEKNRGYGRAIMEGFAASKGEYLGFFDADGTCDPVFFIELYGLMLREKAQIALGSRVHPESRMPPVRRLGNRIFAGIINTLWRTRITDSASGMRMMTRKVLEEVYPLPDGLHFTPVMTCKALSLDNVRIVDMNMPYSERSGKSKLSVVRDGWRFLMTILEMGLSYRPFAFFGTIGIIFLTLAFVYGIPVVSHYLINRNIPDDMIYRIIAVITAVVIGSILFFVNLVLKDFIAYAKGRQLTFEKPDKRFLRRFAVPENIMRAGGLIILLSLLLNIQSLWQYLSEGRISQHWIYTLTGAFLFIEGTVIFIFGVAQHIIYVYKRKL
ncbi:MAG: glycosyltransferase [Candidatus Omnitrophica bacterium]|nr:glycosyltransferase [Candidatus Omnitrophota bacterium]